MISLKDINFSVPYFWLGCLVGGLMIGISFGILQSKTSHSVSIEETVNELISDSAAQAASESASFDNLVTLLFTGDVMLGRSVNQRIIINKNRSWPFLYVVDELKEADITYINLESPLISECPSTDKGMKFCGDLGNVDGLVSAGVDVASVANNHATNYGSEGLTETVNILQDKGISVVGTGSSVTLSRKGSNYNFLSYNDVGRYQGIAQADSSILKAQIKSAKELGGLVVVGFHWGEEYKTQPTPRQISLAHMAIESGADLIIGSHPHWVQTKEIYMNKTIYYSLGNFVFDQEWSAETKKGLAVRFSYRGDVLENTEELPVYIERYGQPRWQ